MIEEISQISKHIEAEHGEFSPPKFYENTVTWPMCDRNGIYFSKGSDSTGKLQEYCHEVWHWIHKDYEHSNSMTYPIDARGRYKFGINPDWDYMEGRATAKSRKLMEKFGLPNNITEEYTKAEEYYNSKL
ncbi:MAG: hypothetical protein FWE31_01000 [Firmicutes bacterium]|nr:hypothetical protein [Bacillota bacterium]